MPNHIRRYHYATILQLSIDCLQSAGRFEPAAYASNTTQRRKRLEATLGGPKQNGRAMHREVSDVITQEISIRLAVRNLRAAFKATACASERCIRKTPARSSVGGPEARRRRRAPSSQTTSGATITHCAIVSSPAVFNCPQPSDRSKSTACSRMASKQRWKPERGRCQPTGMVEWESPASSRDRRRAAPNRTMKGHSPGPLAGHPPQQAIKSSALPSATKAQSAG